MALRELGRILEIKKPDGTSVIPFDTAAGFNINSVFRTTENLIARATNPIQDGKSSIAADPKKLSSAATKNLPSLTPNPMEEFAIRYILLDLFLLQDYHVNNLGD